jgi:phosphopantothenoylcysteine decarboxylase/phosphopantothenate--cysteine ligase
MCSYDTDCQALAWLYGLKTSCMLQGKKVLIGITGSIAAYKIPLLVRLLIRNGAEVKVMMTPSACDFVTPLTLSTLSQSPVYIRPFNEADGSWTSHIELGSWADIIVMSPLSANTMAKMATGITDNLLTAVYLAARCPVFFAPAMDVDMFNHPSTQVNIRKLQSFGNMLIAPSEGELASGLHGFGRLEEPENIFRIIDGYFEKSGSLAGKKLLVTSGPTVEPIDPVRFISNHSSGLMGNSIAMEAASRGAKVTLVSGPVNELPVHPNIEIINVVAAAEMYEKTVKAFRKADIAVMAAAVADYSPVKSSDKKIKKGDNELFTLELKATKDILAECGKIKKAGQILAGFALESDDEMNNASKKLHTKNLDCIVLNSLQDNGAGFGHKTNRIAILNKNGKLRQYELKPKKDVASDILDYITDQFLPNKNKH